MHSKIVIQNHTLAVLSNQLDMFCANPSKFILEPTKIKIPERVIPLMVGSLPPCEFLWTRSASEINIKLQQDIKHIAVDAGN
jgi:hypothetical protein